MTMQTVSAFVPYASDEMLRKSLLLKADALVLDLEDSVTPDNKDSARATVTEWLRQVEFARSRTARQDQRARLGMGQSGRGRDLTGRPDGFLVPKAGDLGELRALDDDPHPARATPWIACRWGQAFPDYRDAERRPAM